jgi:RNA polymerase sigma-54 factor
LLIEFLDDHGMLTDAEHFHRLVEEIDPGRIERVLTAIRLAGPPGIAAVSALDCVRRQVERLVDDGEAPELLLSIVDRHLENAAFGAYGAAADDLGVPVETVELLRRRVRPFVTLIDDDKRPPAPDLVIFFDSGDRQRLLVEATDAEWFGLRLDTALLKNPTPDAREWVEPFRLAAIDFLRRVEMRATMLRRVGGTLIEHQRNFLLGDVCRHRRLLRADVAATLGVHPSTVGRAVDGKLLRCPDGRTIPIAECFGGQTGPKERLRLLFEDHPTANDTELKQLLAQDGIFLARRTVAKYRAALRLPARAAQRSQLRCRPV